MKPPELYFNPTKVPKGLEQSVFGDFHLSMTRDWQKFTLLIKHAQMRFNDTKNGFHKHQIYDQCITEMHNSVAVYI